MESTYNFKDNNSYWIAKAIYRRSIDDQDIAYLLDAMVAKYPNGIDLNGLLIIACYCGTEAMIQKLLNMGASIESRSSGKSTPIMFITQRDMLDMFKIMIEMGADISATNNDGLNCSYYAKDGCTDHYNGTGKVYQYIKEIESIKLKNALEYMKERESMVQKNKELEDKVNFLMEQVSLIQLNGTNSEEPRLRKKTKPEGGNSLETMVES